MKKISYVYPHNGITIRHVHVLHHESLVFDHIVDSMRVVQKEDLEARESDDPFRLMQEWLDQWAVNEVMKFGVMSLYHLWERQTRELIDEQLGKGATFKGDTVTGLLGILRDELSADARPEDHAILQECRKLTNAIKHDTGDGYDELEQAYPMHFETGSESAASRFRVMQDDLRRLFKGVAAFWEALEAKIFIDYETGHRV